MHTQTADFERAASTFESCFGLLDIGALRLFLFGSGPQSKVVERTRVGDARSKIYSSFTAEVAFPR